MFRERDDNLRATQTKLTTAANTIQNQILNVRSVKAEFTAKEIEILEGTVAILGDFKNKVQHRKEKYIRSKKQAEQLEKEVTATNLRLVKRIVKAIPANAVLELSLLRYYYGDYPEEVNVGHYELGLLRGSQSDPNALARLWEHSKQQVIDLLMEQLPNQKHRSGFDDNTGDWADFLHPPEASSKEYVEELVKKCIQHRSINKPENVTYVNEALRLINLARSVNQTVKSLNRDAD